MSDRDHPGRPDPSEQELALAELLGRYIARRTLRQPPCTHDLLAVAAEFGDGAAHELRTSFAFYEAMTAADAEAARRSR